MNTKNCHYQHVEKMIGLNDDERVVHQLRIAAREPVHSESHQQRIRAATQC